MSKVLVTGANGFLGSWLTRQLVSDGHDVHCLVRKNSDLSELQRTAVHYCYGDITDFSSVLNAVSGVDCVFHLAGLVAYKKSDRARMDLINVQGTKNVLDASIKKNISRFVHLSSVVAVGAGFHKNEILNENSEYNLKKLDMGYFETKRQAELLVKEAHQRQLIDTVILNPSTIYGAGDAKKGSRKNQLLVAQGKLKFYTSGGISVVAVEDVVQGILSAWKKGRSGERYILSGENLLIKDLFSIIAELAGQNPPSVLLPDFLLHGAGIFGDFLAQVGFPFPFSRENAWTATLFHWFDSNKAQQELDFKPRPAREALKNSVEWIKNNGLLNT